MEESTMYEVLERFGFDRGTDVFTSEIEMKRINSRKIVYKFIFILLFQSAEF